MAERSAPRPDGRGADRCAWRLPDADRSPFPGRAFGGALQCAPPLER